MQDNYLEFTCYCKLSPTIKNFSEITVGSYYMLTDHINITGMQSPIYIKIAPTKAIVLNGSYEQKVRYDKEVRTLTLWVKENDSSVKNESQREAESLQHKKQENKRMVYRIVRIVDSTLYFLKGSTTIERVTDPSELLWTTQKTNKDIGVYSQAIALEILKITKGEKRLRPDVCKVFGWDQETKYVEGMPEEAYYVSGGLVGNCFLDPVE